MPRDLGKAKRADLTGKFPGEQAEYGSALARFLESSGQLQPLGDGTYLDSSSNGNGHGKETEIPRSRTDTGRSKDTEVAPMPGGNGRNAGADTVFESPLDDAFGQEEMFPEQPLSPLEPLMEPEALSPQPLAQPEPQSLDSVPDLLSPELDSLGEDATEEPDEDTELLERRQPVQDLAPPQSSEDTGMLIAEAFSTRKEDGWPQEVEDDEERKITDKLTRRPEGDEDLTKVVADQRGYDGEKITNKVEPRRDVDPRAVDPDAVVRDTVNFYNQTQRFQEQRKGSGGFPTISPNVVNSGKPLSFQDELTDRAPRPQDELQPDDTDTLRPGPMSLDALDAVEEAALHPDESPVLSPDMQELRPGEGMMLGPDEEPSLADVSELTAEADLEEADKRETDKFTQEDREPPKLPLPEGTDKLDKSEAPPRRRARAGEVEGLEPLADEKVAGGKDTQRFYVAEILAKKVEQKPEQKPGADATDELQPAEDGPPRVAAEKGTGETSSDYTTDSAPPRRRPATRPPSPAEAPLPQPTEVHTDFIEHIHVSASERIIPELDEEAEDGDDTVDEEASAVEKITDRLGVGRPPARVAAASGSPSGRARKISDSLSQRLAAERAETLRLIEQAEAVAIRLREASDASRDDLVALSARRETARSSRAEMQARVEAETVFDEPLPPRTVEVKAPPPEPPVEHETAEIAERPKSELRRVADRVPTRAIGELVSELQQTAERAPASLSALLDQVSRKAEPVNGNGDHDLPDDDIDLLVAASSRLRETVESSDDEDRLSGRMPAADYPEAPTAGRDEGREEPERASRRTESSLSSDLDRLWQVLDSRRATPVSTAIEPATLLIPANEKARITAHEPAIDDGWTQEMLWPTLAGIAVVTFALGAVFVWVLVRLLG